MRKRQNIVATRLSDNEVRQLDELLAKKGWSRAQGLRLFVLFALAEFRKAEALKEAEGNAGPST